MIPVKGCIFDLDGVIVDTAKYHYIAWKRLAEELGFEFTIEDNERLKGVSRMQSLDILLQIGKKDFSDNVKKELAEKKNNWYVEYISKIDKSELLPGVEEFISKLKSAGIKIALGSASKNSMIIMNNLGIVKYFDAIIDGNKVNKAKPDPEIFLCAARELGLEPSECVVFEDAEAGIEAASRAEMRSIGIGSPDILKKAGRVIPGFKDITIDIIDF